MKKFFQSTNGIALTGAMLILIGAALATLSTSLNIVGAVIALIGMAILAAWAFLTGKF